MYHQPDKSPLHKAIRIARFIVLIPFARLFGQGPRATLIWAFVRARLAFTGVSTVRYARVLPNLYICGQIRSEGWRRLQAQGVTSIVNMRREHDDRASGIDVAPEHYLHVPTVDDTPVALDDLKRGADWIAGQMAGGGAVYIHCAAGSGRAPSMGAAYLITHHGMTADQALATIKQVRPFIMPLPAQLDRLREYETWIRNGQAAE